MNRNIVDQTAPFFIAAPIFLKWYLEVKLWEAILLLIIPIGLLRGMIYFSDASLFVASNRLRGKKLYTIKFWGKKADSIAIERRENLWARAEDWSDRRTFSLSSRTVFLWAMVLLAFSYNIGSQRAVALMQDSNLFYQGEVYSSIGATSDGLIAYGIERHEFKILDMSMVGWTSPAK
jgi:hypothetical protein